MTDLYETVRQLVRQELRSHRSTELGTVQAVYPADPDNYDADVVLRDAQLVLKHVPVATPRKGFASLPEVGDLVLVQFVGWLLVNRSIGALSLGLAGLILLLEPVITYFIDITLLGKQSSALQIGGALLTIVAVYVGSIKPPQKAAAASAAVGESL